MIHNNHDDTNWSEWEEDDVESQIIDKRSNPDLACVSKRGSSLIRMGDEEDKGVVIVGGLVVLVLIADSSELWSSVGVGEFCWESINHSGRETGGWWSEEFGDSAKFRCFFLKKKLLKKIKWMNKLGLRVPNKLSFFWYGPLLKPEGLGLRTAETQVSSNPIRVHLEQGRASSHFLQAFLQWTSFKNNN